MVRQLKLPDNKWAREIILFTILFILTILNDRQDFIDPHEFRDGFFIFLMLYVHIQFQRFLVLPFLIKRKHSLYIILALVTILIFATGAYFIDRRLSTVGWYDDDMQSHRQLFLYYFFGCLFSLPILLLVFFVFEFYRQQKTDSDNKILMKDMELNLLRTQLNPHFLFNSLNNLYGISLEKPMEVPDKIMQMSRIMRYQLELSKRKYVSLKEDIDFIKDYVAMEADRVSERCQVYIQCLKPDENLHLYKIAPMILVCFVENAFKHYQIEEGQSKGYINIYMSLEKDVLKIRIANSYLRQEKKSSTQVGLLNVRKRLEILYPERHVLSLSFKDGNYAADLEMELSDTASFT